MRGSILVALAAVSAPAAAAQSLEETLAQRQAELAGLATQVNAAAGADFAVDRQIQLTLRTSVLQAWATRISTPDFTVRATGTTAEGSLIEGRLRPTVRINPPEDTGAFLRLAPLAISSSGSALQARSQLTAHAGMRLSVDAGPIHTNIACDTSPDITGPLQLVFRVGAPTGATIPYVAEMTEPSALRARVVCQLGRLAIPVAFPIDDLAREISRGEFALGYSREFTFTIPGDPPRTIRLALTTQNQVLRISETAIEVGTDVTIAR